MNYYYTGTSSDDTIYNQYYPDILKYKSTYFRHLNV